MIEKVRLMEQRYNELSNKLSEPGIADDQKLFTDLMKEFKKICRRGLQLNGFFV